MDGQLASASASASASAFQSPVYATGAMAMELYFRIRANEIQEAVAFFYWLRMLEPSVYLMMIVIGRQKIAQDCPRSRRSGLDSNADLDTARRMLRLLSPIDHSPMCPFTC